MNLCFNAASGTRSVATLRSRRGGASIVSMPQAALGQLQLSYGVASDFSVPLVSMPQAALGQLQLCGISSSGRILVSMPQAALGQLQHCTLREAPRYLAWQAGFGVRFKKTAIHTILEHVHQSEKASIQS